MGTPSPPRVLHAKFAAYLGWSQPFLHRLVSGLARHVPTSVLCGRIENRDRFPVEDYLCVRTRALVFPGTAAVLAGHLRATRNPKVLHAHFGWSGIRVLLVKPLLGVPLVTSFGGRDAGEDYLKPHLKPAYDSLVRQSEVLICVSEALSRDLVARGAPPDRIHVIRRGTDVSFFDPVARVEGDRGAELRLLMVGRLVKKKGHHTALEALAQLGARGVPARLRIVGEGREKGTLLREARDLGVAEHVEFLGKTDRRGVREQLRWADVFLQCSVTTEEGDREGIPNVVVEAAATGLPVVGTRHGGIPETMDEGRTGLLVDEADARGLEACLVELAGDPERRHRMGAEAAAYVRQHLDETRQIQAHLDLYEALARGEIASCEPPAGGLPGILQSALGYTEAGRDHRTLSAADAVFRFMGRNQANPGPSPGRSTPRPTPSRLRRSFDSLPESLKNGARVTAQRIAPRWIERRRAAHYAWVAGRQQRYDDAIWTRAVNGMEVGPLAVERSTALLQTFLREVKEANPDVGEATRSLPSPA